jgi:LPS O-antigen subunit length determinant protein (WzzB/FepE family)
LGISFVVTPTYESRSVLRLGEGTTALFASDDLLTPLLPLAPWIDSAAPRTLQLQALRDIIKPTFNKKDGTLTLTVSGPSAEQAKKLHLATIDELRKQLLPKGRSLEQTEQRRVTAQATLDELNAVIPALSQSITRLSSDSEASSRAYSLLLQQRLGAQQTLQDIENSLKPFGEEVFAQRPSLPDKAVKPKKALIAIVATLAAGFVLLLFVFVRQAMRNAAHNPQDAQRLQAIKANIARSLGKQS